jgi:CHAT domain-containing protein
MRRLVYLLILFINIINSYAQNSHDVELNQLWDKVDFYQQKRDIGKIIEYKHKLVDLYRNYYPEDLPIMLRNIAVTYDSLPSPFYEKAEPFYKESLSLFSKKSKTDDNVQSYFDCLLDFSSGNYIRKDYEHVLSNIIEYEKYLDSPETPKQKEIQALKNNIKYNSIALIVDSCETLVQNNDYENANRLIKLPANIIETQMYNNIYLPDNNYLCLHLIWTHSEILYSLGKVQESIEVCNLQNKFIRENLNSYGQIAGIKAIEYLWNMERNVAIKYGKIGKIEKEIEISNNIVEEARLYENQTLLAEKLFDLGVSYSSLHTLDGRKKAQDCLLEALNVLMSSSQSKKVIEEELKLIAMLASEYVLSSEYYKSYNLFKKYDDFVKANDTKENEDLILSVLDWKASTCQHLDFPDSSQEEAIKTQKRILDKVESKEGKSSIKYLTEFRTLILYYSKSKFNDERIQCLKDGQELWNKMNEKEQYPEYASFLSTMFVNACEIAPIESDIVQKTEKDLNYLCDNFNPDFHTKINFYLTAAVEYYNNLELRKALSYIDKAKEICQSHMNLSEIKERYAETLVQEANIQFRLNDINKADELANEAYIIFSEFGNKNLKLAGALSSLACIKGDIGDRQAAFAMAMESLQIQKKIDPYGLTPDDIIAPLRYADADIIVEMLPKVNTPYFHKFPSIVNMHVMLARAYCNKGDDYRAEQYCEQAELFLNLYKEDQYFKKNNRCEKIKADILGIKAFICSKKSEYEKAVTLYDSIYQITGNADSNLPYSYAQIGNKNKFIEFANVLYNSYKSDLELHFMFLSEHEKELYMQNYMHFAFEEMESYPSVINIEEAAEIAFNTVLMHKGIALESSRKVKDYISNYDELKSLYEKTLKLKEQHSHVEDSISRYNLQQKIDENEKTIQRFLINNSNLQNNLFYNWRDVSSSLKDNDIVLEFIQIPIMDWQKYSPIQDYKFAALILTKDSKAPQYIELCTESELKNLHKKDFNLYKKENAIEAYNTICGNIDSLINNYSNIYFSPIGLFNIINLEQIFQIKYNEKSFIRLTSSRELCKKNSRNRKLESAVVFGNLDYSANNKGQNNLIYNNRAVTYIQRSNEETGEISPLYGTKDEIEQICKLLTSNDIDYKCYDGNKGTEETYKQLMNLNDISILHIATHGFSIGHSTIKDFDEPMRKCGLLLSGCQEAWLGKNPQNHEDGILIGEEIQNVELKNNDIVILSACETGLGKISSEGVLGLQRAFKKAGAKSIMMSLWKVDDNATSLLISEFYKNYLAGNSKQNSLYKAQKYIREYEDNTGNRLFEDPYYWAGFIILDALE